MAFLKFVQKGDRDFLNMSDVIYKRLNRIYKIFDAIKYNKVQTRHKEEKEVEKCHLVQYSK